MSEMKSHGTLPDRSRSAFGLGYEYFRRGKTLKHNPFPKLGQRWSWFRDGWLARREQELVRRLLEGAT